MVLNSKKLQPPTLLKVILAALIGCATPGQAEPPKLYRYINDEGSKVLDSKIPPEYVQKGYEILSATGKLIKRVPPAPSAAEIAETDTHKETLIRYEALKRRYSSTQSLEAAKLRHMESLDTSISLLKGNITSLQNQLEAQMEKAANREREGAKVPKTLIEQIANSNNELDQANRLLRSREVEKEKEREKFDKDIELFAKGLELIKQEAKILQH